MTGKGVPIGIVTRNRAAYLDVTLRSLSATALPAGTVVRLFDDASDDPVTQAYYSTNDHLPDATVAWPADRRWSSRGLAEVGSTGMPRPRGIFGKLPVTVAPAPAGVVAASCRAAKTLFLEFPDAPYIFLLQDDVVFNADWFTRMTDVADNTKLSRPLGVLAGIKLNQKLHRIAGKKVVPSGITAQCLLITRHAFDRCEEFFRVFHKSRKRFDDSLRNVVTANNLWAGCIVPFVCQHIGIKSLVRPSRRWFSAPSGRIGYYAHPPYVFSETVRKFSADETPRNAKNPPQQ